MEGTVLFSAWKQSLYYTWPLEGMNCVTLAHNLVPVSETLCPLRPTTEQSTLSKMELRKWKEPPQETSWPYKTIWVGKYYEIITLLIIVAKLGKLLDKHSGTKQGFI